MPCSLNNHIYSFHHHRAQQKLISKCVYWCKRMSVSVKILQEKKEKDRVVHATMLNVDNDSFFQLLLDDYNDIQGVVIRNRLASLQSTAVLCTLSCAALDRIVVNQEGGVRQHKQGFRKTITMTNMSINCQSLESLRAKARKWGQIA